MTTTTLAPFVFPAMGTMISIHSAEPLGPALRDRIAATVEAWEGRFSRYRPESELSAVANGTLPLRDASAELRRTRDAAVRWRVRTLGAFDPVGPDRSLDLNGIVKALAIQAIGVELTAAGHTDWCINAGGDVLTQGQRADGEPWQVGVVDPVDRTSVLATVGVAGSRRAVATSGYAERGDHVWRAVDGEPGQKPSQEPSPEFSQVTVLADDIVTADVLATAILAGGGETLDRMTDLTGVDVLAVTATGEYRATNAFRAA